MQTESVDLDIRVRVKTDVLPLNSEDIAEIVAEAIQSRYAHPGEDLRVEHVEVEGDVCWQSIEA